MPQLAALSDAEAPPQSKELFGAIQAAFKAVPNIFRTMGHSPAVLKATLEMNQAIQHDLDPKLRELAYLKASQVNHCRYCAHYHTMSARKVGLPQDLVGQLENFERLAGWDTQEELQHRGLSHPLVNYESNPAFDDLQKDVLRFAEQWTVKGRVDPEVLARLKQRLTPTQLVTLAATVGLANFTNRFNETFGIELP
jgi:AhpD family alkylhydroperoxidase